MKKILAIAAVLSILGVAEAKAAPLDAATIKCSDRTKISKDDISYILFWMYGYLNGKNEDTTIDMDGYSKIAEGIVKKCDENPDLGLLTVMDQVLNDK